VGYVDLRKRQAERAQERRVLGGFRRGVGHDPYLSIAAGIVFGILASFVLLFVLDPFLMDLFSLLLPVTVLIASIILAAFLALAGIRQIRLHYAPWNGAARFGGEKQLLMAIRNADNGITPVEAALETSLTVDEAEEILSRLANRGHLLVKSQDGALSYTLPGRRSDSL
jgi:membrane protein required for beta-lactamase induction